MDASTSAGAANARGVSEADASATPIVNDKRFFRQLTQLFRLKQFFFEEKVKFELANIDQVDLGILNNLRYGRNGRSPTAKEWRLLDEKLAILSSHLNDDLRQRIRIRELGLFFGTLPLAFLSGAIASLIFYNVLPVMMPQSMASPLYYFLFLFLLLTWTLTQGGLGACAFLATRVAIRRAETGSLPEALQDAFELTDENVLKTRVLLGCLFAFLVGLPFSTLALAKLGNYLFGAGGAPPTELKISELMFIFVPFLVGFSTNLVLAVMDRSILAVRTLFGIPAQKQ
jgi:hypothetical protein